MKITTKGQYALLMMVDLATLETGQTLTIKEMAARHHLPERYLEKIVGGLSKERYVLGTRGAKGGYVINGNPDDYTVGMILRTIEGSISSITCLEEAETAKKCERMDGCTLCGLWSRINDAVSEIIDNTTIKDLIDSNY